MVSVLGECVCAGPERGNEDTWSWEGLLANNTSLRLEEAGPSLQTPLSRKVVGLKSGRIPSTDPWEVVLKGPRAHFIILQDSMETVLQSSGWQTLT